MHRIGKLETQLYKSLPASVSTLRLGFSLDVLSYLLLCLCWLWQTMGVGGWGCRRGLCFRLPLCMCVRMPYMFMCVCICAEACGGVSLCVCLHFLSAVNKLPCYRDYIHPHVLPDLYHEFAPASDPERDS